MILFVAFTYASPADKKETAPACSKACTADYTPICGKPKDGKGSDITFGNSCVMESYNCEKSDRRENKKLQFYLS